MLLKKYLFWYIFIYLCSGQHYWEVRVSETHSVKQSWFVGLCRNTLTERREVPQAPQDGCLLLCYHKDLGLFANTNGLLQTVAKLMKSLWIYSENSLSIFFVKRCCLIKHISKNPKLTDICINLYTGTDWSRHRTNHTCCGSQWK